MNRTLIGWNFRLFVWKWIGYVAGVWCWKQHSHQFDSFY
jgi:hypothetical protein